MKRTKSMYYAPSAESTELTLYAENDRRIYDYATMPVVESLKKKKKKGIFDYQKAIDAFYHVANEAAKAYGKEYGGLFTVTERFTAAKDLLDGYMEMIK